MKSPKLYTIRKISLSKIIEDNYKVFISYNDRKQYEIKQSDNMLFRQIRLITNDYRKFNKYVIFVDCKGWKSKEKELKKILKEGFYVNNVHYKPSEKSASMSRNAVMGFVDASIKSELDKRIKMDMFVEKTVLAKLLAYQGLFFSGCFCLENWYPNIIVVDDYSKIIENQHIKYLVDIEKPCINKEGQPYIWKEKGIECGYKDVPLNLWDGSGIHSPEVTAYVKEQIQPKENPTSILWRLPYGKGMTHEVNFKQWFKENGISTITDIFKQIHDIENVDIIVTKSFYKGFKYFQKHKDVRDWNYYWKKFKEYNHCIGVATWNYSFENEPRMKHTSYQILQDLDLPFDDFIKLTDDTKQWIENIINGDEVATYCFLGLLADHYKPSNDYMRAVLKNPEMLKEDCVRNYLINLLEKNIDLMKCGKLLVDGSFKFVVTDLVMFLRYISGMDVVGELKANEFYSVDSKGACLEERVIERNPHISCEEHLILEGIETDLLKKYCSHLSNVCQLNGYSLSLPRLNGADEDGDRIFQINNDTIKSGIKRDLPIVIDIEDKVTALEEEINDEAVIECTIRSMVSLVGEISNFATCYHNKIPKTGEQKKKFLEYINILSICNGKSIDYAKTGVIFHVPRHIAKYAKPIPYFMKYAGEYYGNMGILSRSKSIMNMLAWDIEKWQKKIRFKRTFKDFNYTIMMDDTIPFNLEKFEKIKLIYSDFMKDMAELGKQNAMSRDADNYENYFKGLKRSEVSITKVDFGLYYQNYFDTAKLVCTNQKELTNYAVKICYELNPNKSKRFMWAVASQGILANIVQQQIKLPMQDDKGDYEYLGNKYTLTEVLF